MNLTGQAPYQKGQKRIRTHSLKEKRDEEFRAWVRTQRSCISGEFSEYLPSGEGRCIAAHVRRAGAGGTSYKPLFSSVPLTDAEHKATHQKGDSVLRPKQWWDNQARLYLKRWLELSITNMEEL